MRCQLTHEAYNDLAEIWNYTNRIWSRRQADKYIRDLYNAFDLILENLERAKHCDDIRKGLLRWKEQRHYIFFEVISDGRIEIIRVLHERMDIVQQFVD